MTRFVLITGTDTGVGKTVVAAGIARSLVRRGRSVLAVKPVESGCGTGPREREDGAILAAATGQERPREALTRLAKPVAPPVAAAEEGIVLDHRAWCDEIRTLTGAHEIVLVEGAGGLLSPLCPGATARELALELGASAIVVAADRLGCLNHVLLTTEALRTARIALLGVVFNAPSAPDASTGNNAGALIRVDDTLSTAELPRLENPEATEGHLARAIRWVEEDG